MKFTFNPSPNYRTSQSTSGITKDLTECLLAVLVFAVIYYCGAYGASYGLRIVLLVFFEQGGSLVALVFAHGDIGERGGHKNRFQNGT